MYAFISLFTSDYQHIRVPMTEVSVSQIHLLNSEKCMLKSFNNQDLQADALLQNISKV